MEVDGIPDLSGEDCPSIEADAIPDNSDLSEPSEGWQWW